MIQEKKFISYKDDNEDIVAGYFTIIKSTDNFLKFKSGTNIITIPWNRILKFKENSNDMKGGKI